jgi:hypothetical protein
VISKRHNNITRFLKCIYVYQGWMRGGAFLVAPSVGILRAFVKCVIEHIISYSDLI